MTDPVARVAALAAEATDRSEKERNKVRARIAEADARLEPGEYPLLALLDELREKMGQGIKMTKLKLKSNE